MFRVSDQNGYPYYNSRGLENDTYSSNSRRFKDSHDEMNGTAYGGRNKEAHEHQGWNKSSKFDAYRDSDDDDYKSSGSKGHRNHNEKKQYGGFFGRGSSKSKVLPPYQTVMLKVRTQCDECVRKVRKAVAHIDGVDSISVDMNQKRITIKGNIDPQYVLKKATKTGKSVELVNSKGFGTNFPSYDQQYGVDDRVNASSDYYQQSTGDKYKQNLASDNYQHSNGDRNKKSGNGQNSKGVKFNLTPEYDRRDNGDQYQNGAAARSKKNSDYDQYNGDQYQNGAAARSKKNSDYDQYNGDQYQQGSAGKTKKNSDYDRYGNPDVYRSNSEQGQYSNGQRNRQDSDFYQRSNFENSSQKKDYDRQSSGERFSQKKDYERQSSGDRFRQNLTYPASRDEGSYIFSDENANSCSIM